MTVHRVPDELTTVLERQHHAVTRQQALAAGLTPRSIEGLLSRGQWQPAFRGVHIAFSGPVPFETRAWAGVLVCGAGAAASHSTAAYLDRLADAPGERLHISVPVNRRVDRRDGLAVHLDTNLARKVQPARSPSRTRLEDTVLDLVDRADVLGDVATWVTRACQRRLTTPARLATALVARKKISWRPELEAMLCDVADGAQSPLELRYLHRVERAHGLPAGLRQHRWSGRRVIWVDVDLPSFQVRIELDGRVGHVEEGAFRDRNRDNAGTVHGVATLRYGHLEVFSEPCGVAGQVAHVLQLRGWPGVLRRCGPDCSASR